MSSCGPFAFLQFELWKVKEANNKSTPIASMYGIFAYMYRQIHIPYMDGMGHNKETTRCFQTWKNE